MCTFNNAIRNHGVKVDVQKGPLRLRLFCYYFYSTCVRFIHFMFSFIIMTLASMTYVLGSNSYELSIHFLSLNFSSILEGSIS